MRATAGDRLVIRGNRVGQPDREAVVLEAQGPEGTPPFRVQWSDDGHEGLIFPGPDAHVEHADSSST